jgi:hypothetical protein
MAEQDRQALVACRAGLEVLGSSGRCNTRPFRELPCRYRRIVRGRSWCPIDGGAGALPSTGGARDEQRAGVPGGRCASDDGYAVADLLNDDVLTFLRRADRYHLGAVDPADVADAHHFTPPVTPSPTPP